jgi:hypothetical protein
MATQRKPKVEKLHPSVDLSMPDWQLIMRNLSNLAYETSPVVKVETMIKNLSKMGIYITEEQKEFMIKGARAELANHKHAVALAENIKIQLQ